MVQDTPVKMAKPKLQPRQVENPLRAVVRTRVTPTARVRLKKKREHDNIKKFKKIGPKLFTCTVRVERLNLVDGALHAAFLTKKSSTKWLTAKVKFPKYDEPNKLS